jgi:uncharacterized protein (TIGR02246 family)
MWGQVTLLEINLMKALAIFQTALVMACLASPAAGQGMPENIRQQIDQHLIGRWSSQLDFDEKTTSESFTYRWANAKKKNSLLFSLTTEGYTQTQIGFWDAEKKHFVFQAQTSRGDHFVTVFDKFAEGKWSGHGSGIFDGKVWDSAAALSWPDANSLHYEDLTDGKPWVSKATRVAKSQPAGNFDAKKILAEVEAVLRQWEAAFNAHDAVALSKLYDVKTDVIYDDDVHHRGRKAMQQHFAELFGKQSKVQQTITDVERKVLSRRVVIGTGVWKIVGDSDPTHPTRGRYSCTWMKKKGKWLIVHDRSWGVPEKK